jgi:hypothetical protein
MIYTRKGKAINTVPLAAETSRDRLWLKVNGYTILACYRALATPDTIDYVTDLTDLPCGTIIAGDFNAYDPMFHPGLESRNQGHLLADWSIDTEMTYIRQPGVAT